MNILLGGSNDKAGIENIFKLAIWNKGLYEIGNNNAVENSKLCHIQKSYFQKEYVFPHCNVLKFTWTSPDECTQTDQPIDHILINRGAFKYP
jgi:hypothetical protein